MNIGRLCSRDVHVLEPHETARVAAERMKAKNLGTLVVIDSRRSPVGIVTDRDLVLRVMALGLDPAKALVDDVMTGHPRTLSEDMPVEGSLSTMRSLGVRRMPVVDAAGRLTGMISVDDVLAQLAEELAELSRILQYSRPRSGALARVIPRAPSRSGLERAISDPEC